MVDEVWLDEMEQDYGREEDEGFFYEGKPKEFYEDNEDEE